MGITQPAFSRAIQGLEHTFGCPLVDRASKALPPTPEVWWCCNMPADWFKAPRS